MPQGAASATRGQERHDEEGCERNRDIDGGADEGSRRSAQENEPGRVRGVGRDETHRRAPVTGIRVEQAISVQRTATAQIRQHKIADSFRIPNQPSPGASGVKLSAEIAPCKAQPHWSLGRQMISRKT
jgi:hypothetical protein